MRVSFVALALVMSVFFLNEAQGQHKRLDKAYATYNAGEYYQAIDIFKDAYQKITDKKEKTKITFHVAECYRLINMPKQAAMWYSKVIKKDFEDPIAVLYYADMLKMIEKYDEAKVQYEAYKELVPDDPRGGDGALSCDLAIEWKEFPNGYNVEEMKFINSRANDYAPAFARDDYRVLYFTSTREEASGKKEHGVTGQGFSDILESTMDRKGKWSTPVPMSEEINTEFEEGTPVLSSDYNTLYFTRCQMSERKTMGCQIMMSENKADVWQKAKSLELAPDSVVVAHPAISNDGLTMYFVSDMDGSKVNSSGKASKDLWKVTRSSTGADWGEPVNAGDQINTDGDELFPYLHADGTLYFSSNGHVGMGGLDIFKATENSSGVWEIENLRYPINTSSDDFGICFEKDREAGFLSSTRKGRTDDIYAFVLPPLKFSITGLVKNEKTDLPIEGALVKSIGSDGQSLEARTLQDGKFKFMLNPGTDYVFIASKEGFLQGKERETTKGQEASIEYSATIYLPPIDEPIRIENIFFDFAKADLRPESMVSLDKLVETLNDNPNITVELGSHTDSRGNDESNLKLSHARAQSVVDYLISKGIASDRLVPKGYGEASPKIVDRRDHEGYPFLPEGQELNEAFINTIEDDELQELAHFLNRRTEFRVLSTDYNK